MRGRKLKYTTAPWWWSTLREKPPLKLQKNQAKPEEQSQNNREEK